MASFKWPMATKKTMNWSSVFAVYFGLIIGMTISCPSMSKDIGRDKLSTFIGNSTCLLVFGDSSVDAGNNNHLRTEMKGNFPPYGQDFLHHFPTGRFSNGKLTTDFLAGVLGYTRTIPAFLDPNTKPEDLPYGVTFASGGSGYDDLTSNFSKVLPLPDQVRYLKHYKVHLIRLVGKTKAETIIRDAIYVLSTGTNDFIQNYFLLPIRANEFSIDGYQKFLHSRMVENLKELLKMGARKVVVVGLPPLGCMPLVRTLNGETSCVEKLNRVALSFNERTKEEVEAFGAKAGVAALYVDSYNAMMGVIENPKAYGIEETSKGCCGSGAIEYGVTCRGQSICSDRSKFVYWDAVHPTEKMYQIVASEALKHIGFYRTNY